MKAYLIFGIGIVILSLGCKNQVQNPSLNYSEQKITEVLTDLYVTSEILKDTDSEVKDSMRQMYISSIEDIHNINFEMFESDLKSVMDYPKLYNDIHQDAKDSIVVWFERLSPRRK